MELDSDSAVFVIPTITSSSPEPNHCPETGDTMNAVHYIVLGNFLGDFQREKTELHMKSEYRAKGGNHHLPL